MSTDRVPKLCSDFACVLLDGHASVAHNNRKHSC